MTRETLRNGHLTNVLQIIETSVKVNDVSTLNELGISMDEATSILNTPKHIIDSLLGSNFAQSSIVKTFFDKRAFDLCVANTSKIYNKESLYVEAIKHGASRSFLSLSFGLKECKYKQLIEKYNLSESGQNSTRKRARNLSIDEENQINELLEKKDFKHLKGENQLAVLVEISEVSGIDINRINAHNERNERKS